MHPLLGVLQEYMLEHSIYMRSFTSIVSTTHEVLALKLTNCCTSSENALNAQNHDPALSTSK